jgi:uncharacterized membrane protein
LLAPNETVSSQTSTPPRDAAPTALSEAAPATPRFQRRVLAAVAALVIGYAALSQYSASSPSAQGLAAGLSVAPPVLIGLILVWRWTRWLWALLAAAAVCALLYRYWPAIARNYQWADLAQQCGLYGLVALSFARSLSGGRVPLCTQLTGKMYGALTPAEIAYTRSATAVWMGFYGLLTFAIGIVFFAASLRVWSLFVNFGAFALMMLMGMADHALRRRVLPRHPRSGILTLIQRGLIG